MYALYLHNIIDLRWEGLILPDVACVCNNTHVMDMGTASLHTKSACAGFSSEGLILPDDACVYDHIHIVCTCMH